MSAARLLRGRYGRWLLEGGALFTVLAGAYQIYLDARDRTGAFSEDTCRRAEAALMAPAMNPAMSPEQARTFVIRKLKISAACDKQGGR